MRPRRQARLHDRQVLIGEGEVDDMRRADFADQRGGGVDMVGVDLCGADRDTGARLHRLGDRVAFEPASTRQRSDEHTSELQSLMRISYAVVCLKKNKSHL